MSKQVMRFGMTLMVGLVMLWVGIGQAAAASGFTIPALTNVELNTVTDSVVFQVTVPSDGTPIAVTGSNARYNVSRNSAWLGWTATPGTVNVGDYVEVSIPSSASNNTAVTATLTIGGVSGDFVVTTKPSSIATLSALTLSDGSLAPNFASTTNAYTVAVANSVATLTVAPTTADANATFKIKVNDIIVASGAPAAIDLTVGNNIINTVVTAQDGTTSQTYALTVTRAAAIDDATLSGLALSTGSLTPAFDSITTGYTAAVGNAVSSLTLTPTTHSANATVKVNDVVVSSGSPSTAIALAVGDNTITTEVTAENTSTKKSYTLTVSRAANISTDATLSGLGLSAGSLAPVFASATSAYTVAVGNAVSSLTLAPATNNASATVKIKLNGSIVANSVPASIALVVGANTIETVVTAQDGTTTQSYTLTVTRAPSSDATLSALSLSAGSLSPVFASATTVYTVQVSNGVAAATLTPTVNDVTATVAMKVNDSVVTNPVPLSVGPNVINTVVTAQDGSSKAYATTVTRAAASNLVPTTNSGVWGDRLYVYFGGTLGSAAYPAMSTFSIKVNGQARTVNGIAFGSNYVQLTLATPVIAGDVATVSYAMPATSELQDGSGNSIANFSNLVVSNNTPFPLCANDATVSCIDAVTVTGGTDSGQIASVLPQAWIDANNDVQIQVGTTANSDDLSTLGYDATTRFQLALKLKNYTPRVLIGEGRNVSWNIGSVSAGAIPVSITASPIALAMIYPIPVNAHNWPAGNTDKANLERAATLSFIITDSAIYSTAEKAALTGTVLVSDAESYEIPQSVAPINGAAPALNMFIGGPHFKADGSLHNGFFEAHLPASLLTYWHVTDIKQLLSTYLDSTSFTVVAENGGGARIDLAIHYSSGNVRISVQSAATAPAPTPTPVVDNTPPPVATPPVLDGSKTVDLPAGGEATLGGAATVNVSAGSTINIPTGTASSGAVINLPKMDGNGSTSAKAVTINVGGQTLSIASTASNTVLGIRTVTVNGVSTQVLSVTAGSVSVTASQPNQQLLAVGGGSGSNAIVVTADTVGTAATSTVNASTGETLIAVSSGVVTLPSNAFASANHFSAIKNGKLYAGEVGVLNAAGKITSVRLGSSDQLGALLGDPLTLPGAANLTVQVSVPKLAGVTKRIGGTASLDQLAAATIAGTIGGSVVSHGQGADGVVHFSLGDSSVYALPVGNLSIDTSRSDGLSRRADGKLDIVSQGVVVTYAPAVAASAALAASLRQLDAKASLALGADGGWQVTVNGATYAIQPEWLAAPAGSGQAGFSLDAQGQVVYQDGNGSRQHLYPSFADSRALLAVLSQLDATASLSSNGDGTLTVRLGGKTFTLCPDYPLMPVPTAQASAAWWQDGDKLYVPSSGGKTAQGFSVR